MMTAADAALWYLQTDFPQKKNTYTYVQVTNVFNHTTIAANIEDAGHHK